MAGLLDSLKGLTNFGVNGLSLPSYKQQGCEQAAFPYLEAILIFSFVMFVWGTWRRCPGSIGRLPDGLSLEECLNASCICQIRGLRLIELTDSGLPRPMCVYTYIISTEFYLEIRQYRCLQIKTVPPAVRTNEWTELVQKPRGER